MKKTTWANREQVCRFQLEKRDPEEQGYPQDLPGDLIRILPKLPRTDRKPRFNLELLLSARNQILPFI